MSTIKKYEIFKIYREMTQFVYLDPQTNMLEGYRDNPERLGNIFGVELKELNQKTLMHIGLSYKPSLDRVSDGNTFYKTKKLTQRERREFEKAVVKALKGEIK